MVAIMAPYLRRTGRQTKVVCRGLWFDKGPPGGTASGLQTKEDRHKRQLTDLFNLGIVGISNKNHSSLTQKKDGVLLTKAVSFWG